MLYDVRLKYKDGKTEYQTIFIDNEIELIKYADMDDIKYAYFERLFYKIKLKEKDVLSIVKFPNKSVIYPLQIKVHPKTTLKDIIVTREVNKTPPPPQQPNQWKFKSSSSDIIYTVVETLGKLKCNCPGFYRAKGNCKHIKEVKGK